MATENKAVTVYLPPDLEQYISGYCLEYDVTRNNKAGELQPSLGTGIVYLLRILSTIPISELPDNVPSELPDKLKDWQGAIECNIIEKLSSNIPSKLINSVLKEIQESSGNLLGILKSSVLKELPPPERLTKAIDLADSFFFSDLDISKIKKAIALVDEHEELQGKLENLTHHNREMEAELMAARERIEQLEQQYKESKVTEAETEKPKEEIPDKVRSLLSGTELTGKQLAELIGVDPSYISKYKSGKITPPSWFWDNFEATGQGNKSRWVKK